MRKRQKEDKIKITALQRESQQTQGKTRQGTGGEVDIITFSYINVGKLVAQRQEVGWLEPSSATPSYQGQRPAAISPRSLWQLGANPSP